VGGAAPTVRLHVIVIEIVPSLVFEIPVLDSAS
jgi:hypothetical protein